jgi:hypothetical protein
MVCGRQGGAWPARMAAKFKQTKVKIKEKQNNKIVIKIKLIITKLKIIKTI